MLRNLSLVFLGPRRKHFILKLTRFFSWFPASVNLLLCPVSPSIKSPFTSWDFFYHWMLFLYNCVIINIVFRPTLISFYTRYAGKTSLTTMIVLFFLMGMVTEETHQIPEQSRPNIVTKKLNSPVQFCPFPVYPGWHSHICDPRVLLHLAFTWQEWFPLHSSISEKP